MHFCCGVRAALVVGDELGWVVVAVVVVMVVVNVVVVKLEHWPSWQTNASEQSELLVHWAPAQ